MEPNAQRRQRQGRQGSALLRGRGELQQQRPLGACCIVGGSLTYLRAPPEAVLVIVAPGPAALHRLDCGQEGHLRRLLSDHTAAHVSHDDAAFLHLGLTSNPGLEAQACSREGEDCSPWCMDPWFMVHD